MLIMAETGKILATTKKFDKVISSSYPCLQTQDHSETRIAKAKEQLNLKKFLQAHSTALSGFRQKYYWRQLLERRS